MRYPTALYSTGTTSWLQRGASGRNRPGRQRETSRLLPGNRPRFSRWGANLGRLTVAEAKHSEALDGTDELKITCADDVSKGDYIVWVDRQGNPRFALWIRGRSGGRTWPKRCRSYRTRQPSSACRRLSTTKRRRSRLILTSSRLTGARRCKSAAARPFWNGGEKS